MAGLFGLGGIGGIGGAQPPAGLLGPYFSPSDMRKQQLKQGLLAAGIGLLTGGKGSTGEVLGQGLAAGLQGANNAGINYKQDAMGYQQLDMQMQEQRQKEEEKKRLMDWVSKQPPEMQNFLAVNPEAGAKLWQEQKIKGMYPDHLKPTDDMTEYYEAKKQGYRGTLEDWIVGERKAGATNVTVGGGKYGTIPPGYELVETPQGAQLRAIPGGPAAADEQKAADVAANRGNKQATLTDTIVGAASKARKLIGATTTGIPGQVLKGIGPSDAAELYRQTDVLKSNATIENLNAMRRESPTGGALGNVTEKEGAMLAAAAGAIDPAAGAERYKKALDDYELTLLRIVHGYDQGTAVFEQTRQQESGDGWTTLPNGVKIRKKAQ